MRWRLRPQGRRVPFGGAKRRQDRRQVRRPGRRQAAAQEAAGASGRRPGRRRDERATAPRARRGGSVGTGAALRRPGAAAAAVRILAARAAGAGPVRGGVPLHRPDRGAPRRAARGPVSRACGRHALPVERRGQLAHALARRPPARPRRRPRHLPVDVGRRLRAVAARLKQQRRVGRGAARVSASSGAGRRQPGSEGGAPALRPRRVLQRGWGGLPLGPRAAAAAAAGARRAQREPDAVLGSLLVRKAHVGVRGAEAAARAYLPPPRLSCPPLPPLPCRIEYGPADRSTAAEPGWREAPPPGFGGPTVHMGGSLEAPRRGAGLLPPSSLFATAGGAPFVGREGRADRRLPGHEDGALHLARDAAADRLRAVQALRRPRHRKRRASQPVAPPPRPALGATALPVGWSEQRSNQ